MKKAIVLGTAPAGPDHQVVTVEGGGTYRRTPCAECPWRVDNTGGFPPEAFLHSARTAHDAALTMFACHMSGSDKPATCAGFLLRNADHNLGARLAVSKGDLDPGKVSDGGLALHPDYRTMAVANGVPADAPELVDCRGNEETARLPPKYDRRRG